MNVGIVRWSHSGVNKNRPLGIVVAFHLWKNSEFGFNDKIVASFPFWKTVLRVLAIPVEQRLDSCFDPQALAAGLLPYYAFSFAPLPTSPGAPSAHRIVVCRKVDFRSAALRRSRDFASAKSRPSGDGV